MSIAQSSTWYHRSNVREIAYTQTNLSGDHLGRLLRIRRCARPAAVDVRRQVVNLVAVLVYNLSSPCGASVCAQHDASLEHAAADGGPCELGARQGTLFAGLG